MGFGKAFLFSILAFVGLNFIFTIIYFAIGPGIDILFNLIQFYPILIIYYLFGSIISTPSILFNWIITEPFLLSTMNNLIFGLGYLAALLIAAILAGRFGESKSSSFGSWLLTASISTALIIIGAWLSPFFQNTLWLTYGWTLDMILILAIISCLINVIFYGFFALLLSKVEYY
ncbi:MAG: hypothetical protein ACFFEY_03045 [Candidatus Thorarchaeota archaeon]